MHLILQIQESFYILQLSRVNIFTLNKVSKVCSMRMRVGGSKWFISINVENKSMDHLTLSLFVCLSFNAGIETENPSNWSKCSCPGLFSTKICGSDGKNYDDWCAMVCKNINTTCLGSCEECKVKFSRNIKKNSWYQQKLCVFTSTHQVKGFKWFIPINVAYKSWIM